MTMEKGNGEGHEMKEIVWLDCDPGHDDALAILLGLFSPRIKFAGISTVSGNMPVNKTTRNALNILNSVNHLDSVPVVKGSAESLLRGSKICPEVHGDNGLNGYTFPDLPEAYANLEKWEASAVETMYRGIISAASEADTKVNLVATGPLTNVALLLKVHPNVKEHLSKISILGGAIGRGNTNPVAEFNIEVDPEAAVIVFNSSVDVIMVPLEVSHTVLVTEAVLDKIRNLNVRHANVGECCQVTSPPPSLSKFGLQSEFGKMVVSLLSFFRDTYKSYFGMPDPPLHDPCALAYIIDSSLFDVTRCRVDIETVSPYSAGQTVCDLANIKSYREDQKNCLVATKIDVNRFWDLMLSALVEANRFSTLS